MSRINKVFTLDHILYISSLVLVFLTTVSMLVLAGAFPSVYAGAFPLVYAEDSSVSTATVKVNQSCSMTGTVGTPHSASLPNGTYSGTSYPNGVGTTTLKVFCNDLLGFAIYAIGYTGDTYGNTVLHSDTLGSDYDINTGTYSSGNTLNSTWSMKLSSVSSDYAPTISDGTDGSEDFTNWHVVPSNYVKVAYRTSGTDMSVNNVGTGSSINVTYDAYISATQLAGTYVGQVKYVLVHPSTAPAPVPRLKDIPAEKVAFVINASDIEGSMDSLGTNSTISSILPQAGMIDADANSTVTLIAPNFKREGYGFAGWSTDFEATASSTIYGPNETISTDPANGGVDISENGLILYPVWVPSSGTLQNWAGCSSLTPVSYNSTTGALTATLNSVTALTDSRDGNTYAVARLADGECWMVENLRLDAEGSRGATNIAAAEGYNQSLNRGNFIGLADSEDDFATTTYNSLYSTDGSNGTINIGPDGGRPTTHIPRYNNSNTDFSKAAEDYLEDDFTNTSYDGNGRDNYYQWYSYGNYYNQAAALANTALNEYELDQCYNEQIGTTEDCPYTDYVGFSICPKGWHLPGGYRSDGTHTPEPRYINDWNGLGKGNFLYLDHAMGGTGVNGINSMDYDDLSPSTNSVTGESMSVYWRKFPNNFVYGGALSSLANRYSRVVGRGTDFYYWSRTSNFLYLQTVNRTVGSVQWVDALAPNESLITLRNYDGLSVRCVSSTKAQK